MNAAMSITVSFFIWTGLVCASGNIPDSRVSRIIRVDSPINFICNVSGKSPLSGVPLRVHVNGLESLTSSTAAKAFLRVLLNSADKVTLKNIYMRNYFRVIADVEIDGADLAGILVEQRFAKFLFPSVKNDHYFKKTAAKLPVVPERLQKSQKASLSSQAVTDFPLKDVSKKTICIEPAVKISIGGFHPDMTFEEAVEALKLSTNPPLPIVVLWPEMERNSFVKKQTPIGIELNGSVSLRRCLELLLTSAGTQGGMGLQYYIDDGLITIASASVNFQKKYLRVYDISELAASSPWYDRTGNSGSRRQNGHRNNRFGNSRRQSNSSGSNRR